MRDPLLEFWVAFSGVGLLALNASVCMAWIAIKRHGKLLAQHVRRLAEVEQQIMRLNRQALGVSERQWAEFQQRLADRENDG